MKTKKVILSATAMLLSLTIAVVSCKKKEEPPAEDKETNSASDNSLAEGTSNDVALMASQGSEIAAGDSLSSFRMGDEQLFGSSCATVVRDSVQITITFSGTCLDGRTRSGDIIIDYSQSAIGAKRYRHPGFKCVITSNNYVVDGHQVSVSKTITNTTAAGFNPSTTNLTWSISATLSIVKANSGGTVSWTCNKTKTLLNTSDTTVYHGTYLPIAWHKARIGISGSASGKTAANEDFTSTVTSQLVRDMTCAPSATYPGAHPFIQGTMEFKPGSRPTRYINYGSGACDNLATVTVNGIEYTITLP